MNAETRTKARLDRSTVINAALSVVDADGLEALTIRRLASDLGVTPMALYWHFSDKQALLNALVDQLWADALGALAMMPETSDEWDLLRHVLLALVETFDTHPTLAAYAPIRVLENEAGLTITERTLELLANAGIDVERSAEIARFALCAAVMLVSNQPGVDMSNDEVRDDLMRQKRASLGALSPLRYPRTAAAAQYLVVCDDQSQYFGSGIDLILNGVRSLSSLTTTS